VSKQYRPWAPEQVYLLPPSPTDWLPEGHLAYFILEVVRELDLGALEVAIQAKDPRGERPYAPRMMTSLLLYAYCTGLFSSRRIERATYEDVAVRVIAGGSHPHFTSVNRFRLEHREALSGLFVQVLNLCARAGLKTVGHVSLDGTKVQANASKHKAMSYDRMKQDEKRLQAEIEGLLARAEQVDAAEDAHCGSGLRGDEVPEELRRRESRLRRIREAKAELEKEAAEARAKELREQAAAQRTRAAAPTATPRQQKIGSTLASKSEEAAEKLSPRKDDDDDPKGGGASQLSLHRVPTTREGKPKDEAQRNFTDGDSRIMMRNGAYMQAYNAQAAVSEDQIVVAHGVTNHPIDTNQLVPMLERMAENCGEHAAILTADTSYLSEANASYCARNGVDAYLAVRPTDAKKLEQVPDTEALMARWDMMQKLATPRGKRLYALRKVIVEPVFGQIKGAMGFRRFSLRGLSKVMSEWGIVCLCHNLLKLFRAPQAALA
jgi:transposase